MSAWDLLDWMKQSPSERAILAGGCVCLDEKSRARDFCLRPELKRLAESRYTAYAFQVRRPGHLPELKRLAENRYTGLAFVSCSHVGRGWRVELQCEDGVPIHYDVSRDELTENRDRDDLSQSQTSSESDCSTTRKNDLSHSGAA